MLQANVGAIRAEMWETIHKELLKDARRRKLDSQPRRWSARSHPNHAARV